MPIVSEIFPSIKNKMIRMLKSLKRLVKYQPILPALMIFNVMKNFN